MNFLEVLYGAEVLTQSGNPGITGLEYDSRRVKPGDLFVAMRGESVDGNKFIDQAIAAGASDAAIERGVSAAQSLADALPPDGDADERANLLGFLFQSYAATARLIENRLAGRTEARLRTVMPGSPYSREGSGRSE